MYTGKALARALRDVRDLWVPMNDRGGGYFPVMVSAWRLTASPTRVKLLRPPSGHGPCRSPGRPRLSAGGRVLPPAPEEGDDSSKRCVEREKTPILYKRVSL